MLEKLEDNATKSDAEVELPIKQTYETYMDRILTVYNVSDKILLLSMIADTVDNDLKERTVGSEIALEEPFFAQGKIVITSYSIHYTKLYELNITCTSEMKKYSGVKI